MARNGWSVEVGWSAVARLLLDLGLAVLMLVVLNAVSAVRAEQEQGQERGYRNRAAACRLQVGLGMRLDDTCLDPLVVRHYDPNEPPTAGASSEGQRRNQRLLCAVLAAHGATSPDCAGT